MQRIVAMVVSATGFLVLAIGLVLIYPGRPLAQEQSATPPLIHLDGRGSENLPPGHVQGIPQNELRPSAERKTEEPGHPAAQSGGTTTLYVGERGQTSVTVIQNKAGESGLLIEGKRLTEEERARRLAKQHLDRGSVRDGTGPIPATVETTVHADSIIVQSSGGTAGPTQNKACVKIGSVGGAGTCADR